MRVVGELLMVVGAALMALAAVGVLRFPGPLSRMHASSKAGTSGVLCLLVGAGFALGATGAITKLLLVAVLQFLTAPAAAGLLARAARSSGVER